MNILPIGRTYHNSKGEQYILWLVDHMDYVSITQRKIETYVKKLQTDVDLIQAQRKFRQDVLSSPVLKPHNIEFLKNMANSPLFVQLPYDDRMTFSINLLKIVREDYAEEEHTDLMHLKFVLQKMVIDRTLAPVTPKPNVGVL